MADLNEVNRIKTRTEERFRNFRSKRQDLLKPLVRGRLEPEIDDTLSVFAGKYAIRSQDLRFEVSNWTRSRMVNETKIDVVALEDTDGARRKAEDTRIWLASWLSKFNHGRRWDEQWANSVSTLGVACFRLFGKLPEEPEGLDASEGSYEKRRMQAYLKTADACFNLVYVNPGTMAWGPNQTTPKHILEDAEVETWEAESLKRKSDGQRPWATLDGTRIEFYSQGSHPDYVEDNDAAAKKLHFVVYEYEKPDGKWWHCEYVYPENGSLKDGGELLDEYELPFGRSSYFIAASGSEMVIESDPDLRYVPPLMPMMDAVHDWNFWRTYMGLLALQQGSGRMIYHRIPPNMNDNALQALEESGMIVDRGNERYMVLKYPDPDVNEIAQFSGDILPMPGLTPEHLVTILELDAQEIQRFRTNRFVIGDVSPEETSQAPTSTILSQMQAAQSQASADLAKLDRMKEEVARALCNFIQFFDEGVEDEGKQKLYPVVTTGDEPVMKGAIDAGTEVVMSAAKLRDFRFEINVFTDAATQGEKSVRDQAAYFDYAQKTITFLQLVKRLEHEDPEQQVKEIDEEGFLIEAQRRYAVQVGNELDQLYMALTGIQLGAMTPAVPAEAVSQSRSEGGPDVRQPGPTQAMGAPMIDSARGGA